MPYATTGGVSRADKSGDPAWIEITDEQYAQALAGMAAGRLVSIESGFALVDPPKPEEPGGPEPEPGPPVEPLELPGIPELLTTIQELQARIIALEADK